MLAAVEELDWMEDEDDWSTPTGAVAAVVVVSVAVLEDLVLLLQPLRANPARIKENNVVFFIGGLSCPRTDRSQVDRFANQVFAARMLRAVARHRGGRANLFQSGAADRASPQR